MRLPRFRVSMLMILVMLAGVGFWGCMMWGRSVESSSRANYYRELETQAEEVIADLKESGQLGPLPDGKLSDDKTAFDAELERIEGMRESFRRARLRYEHAARYPWLSVAPDHTRS